MDGALPSSYLMDAKIAAYAVASEPAWLWQADGTRVLWTNAAGASVFGASTASALTLRSFEPSDRTAQQVAQMAETLTHDGAARLERFTGFGSALLRPVTCICSRVTLKDAPPAILICGVEPQRPALPLIDRLQRLLVDADGALAAFTTSGDLLFATASARARLPSPHTLDALGATELASKAVAQGASTGLVSAANATLWRIGRADEILVMLRLDEVTEPAIAAAQARPDEPVLQIEPETAQDIAAEQSTRAATSEVRSTSTTAARRHPLRFVWRMDTAQNFTLVSDDFLAIASTITAQHNGEPWSHLRALLALDPLDSVAQAIATRDTWSGIILSWPTRGNDHLTVELAGLPIFDRQREFIGYRGFGVCRDTALLERLASSEHQIELAAPHSAGQFREPAFMEEPVAPLPPPPVPTEPPIIPAAANVVPFPSAPPLEARPPGFSAGDRKAFSDIAQQLAARLKNAGMKADAAEATPPLKTTPAGRIDGRADAVANTLTEERSSSTSDDRGILDRLPFGVLTYRAQELLYANRSFLDRVGYASLEAFADDGGLDNLLLSPGADPRHDPSARKLTLQTPSGSIDVEAWLIPAPFDGEPAYALVLDNPPRAAVPNRASIRDNGHDRALDKIFEQQLTEARRRADQAAAARTALVGDLSRDIRSPLTAIVGFAESILSERFGPLGNERYRDYLSGIHNAGARILAVIEHLGETSPTTSVAEPQDKNNEPVRADVAIDLNEIVRTSVSELQADAARDRVLVRTSLTQPLPSIFADAKAVRQIVQNLMTNSIKLAGAGGQVIVSTAVSETGMVSLRLRDTGMGLNESEVAASMRQSAETPIVADTESEGRLKIAVAKALAEANRASLTISSRPNDGTLVEVSFSERTAPAA